MKTKTVIESYVDGFSPQWFDDSTDDFQTVASDEEVEAFAEQHHIPVAMVRLVVDSLESLKERLADDLADVWERLDSDESARPS